MLNIALIDGSADQVFFVDVLKLLDANVIEHANVEIIDSIKDIDICLSVGESEESKVLAIRLAKKKNIPTLMLMDGIVEWRNTWEHFSDPQNKLIMPLFQPVLSHKIACYGYQQARFFNSLGNEGKSEIVGSPRFDYLKGNYCGNKNNKDFNILVATAKTPSFSEKQHQLLVQSLKDVLSWSKQNREIVEKRINFTWRLKDELYSELGIVSPGTSVPLVKILQSVDAVITTPSTLILEAMLLDKPVAILDYTNSPQYIVPSWTINSKKHLDWWIPELINPPTAKILHQRIILNDLLYLDKQETASQRLANLITEMVNIAHHQRNNGMPITYGDKILQTSNNNLSTKALALVDLYPDIQIYSNDNFTEIKTELEFLKVENKKLRKVYLLHKIYTRYGYGSLFTRLIHCFPYPRRMLRSIVYWQKEKKSNVR